MKKGFAPAAVLVLLLVVAGLGLVVTRTTDLKNVFQKPKAAELSQTTKFKAATFSCDDGYSSSVGDGICRTSGDLQIMATATCAGRCELPKAESVNIYGSCGSGLFNTINFACPNGKRRLTKNGDCQSRAKLVELANSSCSAGQSCKSGLTKFDVNSACTNLSQQDGFTLTVAPFSNGKVLMGTNDSPLTTCTGSCNSVYPKGAPVNVTAIADSGYVISGWGGDCSTGVSHNAALPSCRVDMDGNKNVSVSFKAHSGQQYTLRLMAPRNGAITGTGNLTDGSTVFKCDSNGDSYCHVRLLAGPVTLQAIPNKNYSFYAWNGSPDLCGAGIPGGSDFCNFTLDRDTGVGADFTLNQPKYYTLTVSKPSYGTITGNVINTRVINCGVVSGATTCEGTFIGDTIVVLSEIPNGDSTFIGWTGNCSKIDGQCPLKMDGNKTVGATFSVVGAR